MFKKVYEVDDVRLTVLRTNPLTLRITATGLVPTSGYSDPELAAWIYVRPPKDGIYSFDLIARAPNGPALQVLLPITAVHHWQPFPKDLKGVRVVSASNEIVAMLNKADEVEFKTKKL